MSERLEKIAGIISWIQNMDGHNATFGDVAFEFGPNDGDIVGRDDHIYNNITKNEYFAAKKLLEKKSYVGSYDPNIARKKRIAARKKEMGDSIILSKETNEYFLSES